MPLQQNPFAGSAPLFSSNPVRRLNRRADISGFSVVYFENERPNKHETDEQAEIYEKLAK
jgi:hypothetical protein